MVRRIRCAIYTRKSSEEGLEQDFNSLDAQYEACTAYVTSQKAEGWVLLPARYDDGGLSGGTLERPALQRLLCDIEEGLVDQIVVYKIDRLTRSLSDFARIVDRLDAAGASFVSVTQSFNTATSMGRLTLNMLLSFAQFEREVTAERICDKIAASKKKGLWMGGTIPFGYQADGRTLIPEEEEAEIIRSLYQLYMELGSVREVAEQAEELGYRTRLRTSSSGKTTGGGFFTRGHIHKILTNPLYAGRIRHKDKVYEGQHPSIIDPELWQQVQDRLTGDAARERGKANGTSRSPLAGKLFDETGDRLTPHHANRSGKRHRYYVSRRLVTDRRNKNTDAWRLPARDVEHAIARILREHLQKPIAPSLMEDITASELPELQNRLLQLAQDCNPDDSPEAWAPLLHRADLTQGRITLHLHRSSLAERLNINPNRIAPDACTIIAPFRMRRRGLEAKIILGAATPLPDPVLARNILTARRWYEEIKAGTSFTTLAGREQTTTSRIQQIIDLAFLAPDILDQVAAGRQPLPFTSEWIKYHSLPADWQKQCQLIDAL